MKDKKNKLLIGTLILTITSLLAKVIGAFFRVPLINILGSNGLGIFQLIFPIFSFFLIFVSGGTSLGVSKLVCFECEQGNHKNAKQILKASLVLMLGLSVLLGLVMALLSVPLSIFQGNRKFASCYLALIPALIFSCLISAFRGYFQGKQNMLPTGISMILEQLAKVLCSLFLASRLASIGLVASVCGAFLGISISELVAFLYILFQYIFSSKHKPKISLELTLNFRQACTQVIKTCFPIMLNGAIMPLMYAIESTLVIWLLSKASISTDIATSLFGLEDGLVGSLVNLPTVVASALSTALIPSVASSYAKGDLKECGKKSVQSIKFAWLIALPCCFAFLLLSQDIVLFLYKNGLAGNLFDQLKVVVDLVRISSINILYVSLLSVVTAILQAINKSYVPVKNLLIACIFKTIFTFLLVSNPKINIYGLVISDVVCFSIALMLNVKYLKTQLEVNFKFNDFLLKPAFCVGVMLVSIELSKILLKNLITSRLLTLCVVLVGGLIYLTNLLITKTIKKEEIISLTQFKRK